ncbi:MAG: IPT/TIG domain-containing protein, partial [Nitrospirae bacterium]|nr:IPT/TIG domain-containing protein [Nitrospirota bacterium]
SPPGIDCGATCAAPFDAGSSVTLTAAPDATSTFAGWAGAGCAGTGPCVVTIDAAQAVTATFTRIQYVLDVTKTGTGGGTVTSASGTITCGSTCSAPFDAGSSVTLTAAPDATSTFAGWVGAGCTGTGTCVVPMTAAQTVTATFTRIQYALTVTKIGTGSMTAAQAVTATFTQLPPPPVIDPNGLSLKYGVIGDTLKIKGSSFGAAGVDSLVTVGTIPATVVQRWNDKEIVALIPAGLPVSSTGTLYDVVVAVNGQQSNPSPITLLDRVLGVGGENGDGNLDQFVLQVDTTATSVVDISPTDLGSSSAVALSVDGTTAAEADGAIFSASGAASEWIRDFNTSTPLVGQLQITPPSGPFVFGQDIAVSRNGSVALIAAGNAPLPNALMLVTTLGTASPTFTPIDVPPPVKGFSQECALEVALSADGNTAAVITAPTTDTCIPSLLQSPYSIYRIDNLLSTPSTPSFTLVSRLASTPAQGLPPDRLTDLAISEDGTVLIAGRVAFDASATQWQAGIVRITNFSSTWTESLDLAPLASFSSSCWPESVDVDLTADGITAIVGIVRPASRVCSTSDANQVFKVTDADLTTATSASLGQLPKLESVALNSGGSIALVRVNKPPSLTGIAFIPGLAFVRFDGFNQAAPVPTTFSALANLNTTTPLRPQDQLDLQ